MLAACSDAAAERQPGPSTLPFDPSRPWWLQGNYAPVMDEIDAFDLPVRGAIPPELVGLYVRNGSNPQKLDSPHWFFGDGMLHGVRLENGKARWYRNRYVRTTLYNEGRSFGEGGGPPSAGNNQSNVSVVHHGGRLLTSGEIGFPFQIDPTDLSTIGIVDFGGTLQTSFTAHPKIDPATGHLHFFGYWFLPPFLSYHVADANGVVIQSQTISVEKSTMVHSFAITDRDVVFWELPVLFDLDSAIAGADNPFSWKPDYGARIGVMPLGGSADQIRWVEIEPCYVFHEVNAHRDGTEVVLDVCRHPDMFNGTDLGEKPHTITRWRIDTAGDALALPRRADQRPAVRAADSRPAFHREKATPRLVRRDARAPRHRRSRRDRPDRFRERPGFGLGPGAFPPRRRSVLRRCRRWGRRGLPFDVRLRSRDGQEHAGGARRDQRRPGTRRRDRAAAPRASRFSRNLGSGLKRSRAVRYPARMLSECAS